MQKLAEKAHLKKCFYLNLNLIWGKALCRYWPSRISESNLGSHPDLLCALSKGIGKQIPQHSSLSPAWSRYSSIPSSSPLSRLTSSSFSRQKLTIVGRRSAPSYVVVSSDMARPPSTKHYSILDLTFLSFCCKTVPGKIKTELNSKILLWKQPLKYKLNNLAESKHS